MDVVFDFLSVLVATLVMMEYGLFNSSFDPYWAFSAGGTAALAGMLVVHQGKVSNTVLWTGSIGILHNTRAYPSRWFDRNGLAWVLSFLE